MSDEWTERRFEITDAALHDIEARLAALESGGGEGGAGRAETPNSGPVSAGSERTDSPSPALVAADRLAEAVDRIVAVDALHHGGHATCTADECEVKYAEECAASYLAARKQAGEGEVGAKVGNAVNSAPRTLDASPPPGPTSKE